MINKEEGLTRTFQFNTRGCGHRFNAPTIDIRLRKRACKMWDTMEEKEVWTFSACGHYTGSWGQNLDEIAKAAPYVVPEKQVPILLKLVELWTKYHLNDMQAGDKAQTECLANFKYDRTSDKSLYEQEKEYLDAHGMLIHNGYKFGTAWLCQEIPEEDLQVIFSLIRYGLFVTPVV